MTDASERTAGAEAPALDYFATITAIIEDPIELGEMKPGRKRVIPISGGSITGSEISGRVLPGGADFQTIRSETVTEVVAKYAFELTDGEHIEIENVGIRTASAEDAAALAAGQTVPPERVYFRCVPRLVGSGKWSWVDEVIFIASGRRFPDRVEIDLFIVR
jgi:hypothetical protein